MSSPPQTVATGSKIRKYFPGYGWYDGVITSYRDHIYCVSYEDGDCEDFYLEDLHDILVDDDDNLHSPPLKKLRKTARRRRKTVVASVVTLSPPHEPETNLRDPPGVAPLTDESDEANEEEEILEPISFLQPNLGDRVFCKYSNGEWYWGVVKNKFWKRNYLYYSIQYDDGEYVKEHRAVDGIATEAQYNYDNNQEEEEKEETSRINNLDGIILNVLADSGSESESDDDDDDDEASNDQPTENKEGLHTLRPAKAPVETSPIAETEANNP